MGQFRRAIIGLQVYNPTNKRWCQAHTQGAYVFTQFLYQNQKTDIVKFELLEEDDFVIHLNKENLMAEGRQLIELFLCTLQTYKSSGAAQRAQSWYNHYSVVDEEMIVLRDIVMKKKGPGRLCLYSNLTRYSEE